MAKKMLLVIDVQNDFVDGALGTKEAQAMLPTLLDKVRSFDGDIIYTKDTHPENYLETQEGKNLPVPHCIKGTKGWELVPALAELQQKSGSKVYEKPTFGSVMLAHELHQRDTAGEIASIELRASSSSVSARTSASSRTRSFSKLPCRNFPSPSTPPVAPVSRQKNTPRRSK